MSDTMTIQLNQPFPEPLEANMPGTRANFMINGSSMLLIAEPKLSKREIDKYRKGKVRMGLYREGTAMLLLFTFDHEMAMACPFNPCLIPDEYFTENAEEAKHTHRLVSLVLVDTADNCNVKALRAFTIPPKLNYELTGMALEIRASKPSPSLIYMHTEIALGRQTNDQLVSSVPMTTCGAE